MRQEGQHAPAGPQTRQVQVLFEKARQAAERRHAGRLGQATRKGGANVGKRRRDEIEEELLQLKQLLRDDPRMLGRVLKIIRGMLDEIKTNSSNKTNTSCLAVTALAALEYLPEEMFE
jgi:hypothetical protein